MTRAATMLQQQQHMLGLACQELDNFMEQQQAAPAPAVVAVAVSERLPEQGDCDAEERCWVHVPRRATPFPSWTLLWKGHLQPYHSHWLPFHAIPLPQAGKTQP